MPAVDFKRFNRDSAGLLQHFGQPAEFLPLLHAIFEQYANRTIRSRPSPLTTALPTYQVPLAVVRHLEMLLAQPTIADPQNGLRLILALWQDGVFEGRILAAQLLGKITIESATFVDTIGQFVQESNDAEILDILLNQAMDRFRQKDPIAFLRMLASWVATHEDKLTSHALTAIHRSIQEDEDLNLPEIINIITPPLRAAPQTFQPHMLSLIAAIYTHSESEAVYFIRQLFADPFVAVLPAVFRRILPSLPPDLQPAVTDLLREKAPLAKNRI